MFRLDGVCKTYGEVVAIESITSEIPSEALVVIMGPSGSGKSTLLRLLSFIETPTSGVVSLRVNGQAYASNECSRPWPEMTCVFQGQFLWPHLTLLQNISLPLKGLPQKVRKDRVESMIALFQMEEFIDRYPNEVSGGQAQRAALARALALKPRLVLIDEAHTGLDLDHQRVLNDHLLKLRAEGVGLVVVSHSPEFALRCATHIGVVQRGNLVEFAPVSDSEYRGSAYLKAILG